MKKNILLILLSSALLASCSFSDIISFGKKDNDSSSKEPENQENNDNKEQDKNTQSKTVNFYGSYLPSEWTDPGINLDSTLASCSSANDLLIGAVNPQVNDSSQLSELFFTNLHAGYYETSGLVLQLGSGQVSKGNYTSGTLVWTSVKKIKKVEVVGQCYTKPAGATDTTAHMTIEAGGKGTDVTQNNDYQRPITNSTTKDMSFAVEAEETLAYKTYTNEYPDGINRFCLTSLEGRMFLKSLTITWEL